MIKSKFINLIINNKTLYIILATYGVLSFFFITNMWDAYQFDYAFYRNNLKGLNLWAIEHSHRCYLVIINVLYFVKSKLGFNNELIFDLFNFTVFCTFIFQITKLGTLFFGLDKKWSTLLSIVALSFPSWETFTSLVVGFYLFYFNLAIIGFNFFFYSKNKLKIIFGFFLILNSLCVQSNYGFLVGLILCFLINSKYNKENLQKSILCFFVLIIIFFFNYFSFPSYGFWEDYNNIKLENFNPKMLFKNFINYSTFFIFSSWILIVYLFLNHKNKNYLLSKKNLATLIFLLSTSIFPYLSIDKSTDLFAWKDYLGRHALLLGISYSLFYILILKGIYFNDIKKNKNIFKICLIIFLLQNSFIIAGKLYFKIEASIFHKNFVYELKKFQLPESGLVEFYTSEDKKFDYIDEHNYLPGHRVRNQEISVLFFKAYQEASWAFFIQKSKSGNMLDFEKYKTMLTLDEFDIQSNCKVKIFFTKNLSYFERIKKLYIFNSKKYYNIRKLITEC